MLLDYTRKLDMITKDNTFPAHVPSLEEMYTKQIVDKAIHFLTYKNLEELPKSEDSDFPILYVFRHGETQDNADMIFCGWRDVGLTETGVQQAEILAEKLKDKKIDRLYSSDMIRAIDTMKIAMSLNPENRDKHVAEDNRLRERNYGEWQGYSKLQKHLEDPEGLHKVRRGYEDEPPNGESLHDTVNRVSDFLDELLEKMRSERFNAAISCHGNSIRGIRQYFEGLSNEDAALIETPLGKDYAAYVIK